MRLTKGALEEKVRKGMAVRKVEKCLHGGIGRVIIYTDTSVHDDPKAFEAGKILMEHGSRIGIHAHPEGVTEDYTILTGKVIINGRIYRPGETAHCPEGQAHYAHNLLDESIIEFVKRK